MTTKRRTRVRKVLFWRWRHNSLRRRSDRVEAWIVLAVWTFALLGGLAAGLVAGAWVDHDLAARRSAVHAVSAVLVEDAPKATNLTPYGSDEGTVWAKVRWTDAGGKKHTARAKVEPGGVAGSSVTVWLNRAGVPVTEPPSAAEAQVQAALLGVPAGLGAGALVLVGGRLVRDRLDRRRLDAWALEWEQVGPGWRKRMFG